MQRYFIYLAYDGTAYHGWQIQPNALSVQQCLETCLSTLLRRTVAVTGAGRTDTGVHARMMVAHFDAEQSDFDVSWLTGKLNRLLPPDISVYGVYRVVPEAHARFSALSRTYHYYIHIQKDAFFRSYSWRPLSPLNFERMNQAAARLTFHTDFASFSNVHTDVKTSICRIDHAAWNPVAHNLWRFEIKADRFLRNMVRAIVGTLIDVGRGKLSVEGFDAVIQRRTRSAAGESVPAKGLFLVDIAYPPELFMDDLPDKESFFFPGCGMMSF